MSTQISDLRDDELHGNDEESKNVVTVFSLVFFILFPLIFLILGCIIASLSPLTAFYQVVGLDFVGELDFRIEALFCSFVSLAIYALLLVYLCGSSTSATSTPSRV